MQAFAAFAIGEGLVPLRPFPDSEGETVDARYEVYWFYQSPGELSLRVCSLSTGPCTLWKLAKKIRLEGENKADAMVALALMSIGRATCLN